MRGRGFVEGRVEENELGVGVALHFPAARGREIGVWGLKFLKEIMS